MDKNVILGKNLMTWFSGSSDTKISTLGSATSCKLQVNADALETSSKDSGCWKEQQASQLSYTLSTDCLYTVAGYKKLVDQLINRTPIAFRFSTLENADTTNGIPTEGWTPNTDGYSGMAIVKSVDVTAANKENANYTASFEGTGPLKEIPTT